MANNNGLNVLDAITAAKLGKGTGGSSGGVTKEYVDAKVGAVSERVDDVESVIPFTATPQNPLATTSDVSGTAIPSTSTASPVTDSADGMAQGVTVYGKSEVVDGDIHSAGEGYAVVDLGTLDWTYIADGITPHFNANLPNRKSIASYSDVLPMMCAKYDTSRSWVSAFGHSNNYGYLCAATTNVIGISDSKYTDPAIFKSAMSSVLLCYQLADPTQGNCVAVKTDDGTGIGGTMAVFETALPLRGVSETVRDKLTCTAEKKQVETVCGRVRLADLAWLQDPNRPNNFYSNTLQTNIKSEGDGICSKYIHSNTGAATTGDKLISFTPSYGAGYIFVKDTDYTTLSDFVASLGDAELIYELATPTTTPLTTAEISEFRGLRTFDGTTNITISDEPDFEIDYLKNTENGQAVANIQMDLQEQISNMITLSPLLTLTAAGWDSTTKQQTVTFAHDTSRRNVIDITAGENAAWDSAGVYAVSETAAGITFECSEMPETALTFRVTSMEVS